jgi:putative addiction module component (TIGR02574 family)
MPKTLSEVTRDAAELLDSDRLKLARILLDLSNSGTEPTPEADAEWDQEIERRLEELRSGRVKGIPLDEVKRKLEQRFGF